MKIRCSTINKITPAIVLGVLGCGGIGLGTLRGTVGSPPVAASPVASPASSGPGGPHTLASQSDDSTTFRRLNEARERVWQLFESGGNQAPAEIAGYLGGNVATAGSITSDSGNFTVSAQGGHCYSVIARLAQPQPNFSADVSWTATPSSSIQRYSSITKSEEEGTDPHEIARVQGFCASQTQSVSGTFAAHLGVGNSYNYVVVETRRQSLPFLVALRVNAFQGDDYCNPEEWLSLWSDPVPGSIGYVGSEPIMLNSPSSRSAYADGFTMAKTHRRIRLADFRGTPTGPVTFADAIRFPENICIDDPTKATSPVTQELAECNKRIQERFTRPIQSARDAVESARTLVAAGTAQERLEQLVGQRDSAWEQSCKPIKDRARAIWMQRIREGMTAFAQSPYRSPIPRAAALATFRDPNR